VKKCVICGNEFFPKNKRQVTCSLECGREYKRYVQRERKRSKITKKELECEYCGKKFIPEGYRHLNTTKFCSRKCYNNYNYHKGPKPTQKKERRKAEPRDCEFCGTTFIPDISHNFARFCSADCNTKYHSKQRSEKRAVTREEYLKTPHECRKCKNTFVAATYGQIYCSEHCRNEMKKEKNRERYAKLPEAERRKIKDNKNRRFRLNGNWKKALERDGHKCVLCNEAKALAVHHLNANGERDKNNLRKEGDSRLENLITLCSQCHKDIHGIFLIFENEEWTVRSNIFKKLNLAGTIKISE